MALGRQVDIAVLQFTASYEADLLYLDNITAIMAFQFTASYEADLASGDHPTGSGGLSSHSLIRG